MNNIELTNMFEQILQIPNGFDRIVELKQKEKEYKKSNFYKQTRIPIDKAYSLFLRESAVGIVKRVRDFMNPQYMGLYLSEVFEGVSSESLQNLFDSIMSLLNIEELVSNAKELGEQIKTLK